MVYQVQNAIRVFSKRRNNQRAMSFTLYKSLSSKGKRQKIRTGSARAMGNGCNLFIPLIFLIRYEFRGFQILTLIYVLLVVVQCYKKPRK